MKMFKGPGELRREKASRFWTTTSKTLQGLQEELNKRDEEGWEPRWVFHDTSDSSGTFLMVFEHRNGSTESEHPADGLSGGFGRGPGETSPAV